MRERSWDERYWPDVRWASLWLAAILAVAFAPFVLGQRTLLASADLASLYPGGATNDVLPPEPFRMIDVGAVAWQTEPWLQTEHDALLIDHRIPWWDPYDGYGAPFAASQQPQPFFPLTMLVSLAPSPWSWNVFVVARLATAGIFAIMFMRLFAGRLAALGSGLATGMGGYFLLFYGMPEISAAIMFPALLWATECLIRRPGYGPIAALGCASGLTYLGGMPETEAVALVGSALYFVVRLGWEWRHTKAAGATLRVGAFIAANAVGVATGGVMLVPFAEYLDQALDQHRGVGHFPGYVADSFSLVRAVFQRMVPLSYGPPWNSLGNVSESSWAGLHGFFGVTTAFGAFVAVFASAGRAQRGRRDAGAVAALTLLLVIALGKTLGAPWVQWIGGIPVLRLINFPKYGELLIEVPAALLCGFGIAAFERGRTPSPWLPAAAAASVAVLLTAGIRDAQQTIGTAARLQYLWPSATFAAALVLGAALVANLRRASTFAALGLTVLVGVEALGDYYAPMFGSISPPPAASRNPYAGAAFVSALHAMNPGGMRVYALSGLLEANWSGAMRIDSPTSINALYPQEYLPFVRAFIGRDPASAGQIADRFNGQLDPPLGTAPARRWLTLSSIGFVVVPALRQLVDPHLRELTATDVRIYAYDDPLPRASVFHAARFVADADEALRAVSESKLDVHRTVILVGTDVPAAPPSSRGQVSTRDADTARITQRDGSNVTIAATLARPGFLMLNDTYFPGWTATVDGVPAEIFRADYLFRAVRIGPGTHIVHFAYASRSVALGIALTLLGSIVIVACAARALVRVRFAAEAQAR